MLLEVSCSCICDEAVCLQEPAQTPSENEPNLFVGGTSDSGTAGGVVSIYFEYKKIEPIEAGEEGLRKSLSFLKRNQNIHVTIEGHGDMAGGELYNKALGLKRAKKIRDYLIDNGIDKNRLETKSMGSSVTLSDPNITSALNNQKDRRVNFVIKQL